MWSCGWPTTASGARCVRTMPLRPKLCAGSWAMTPPKRWPAWEASTAMAAWSQQPSLCASAMKRLWRSAKALFWAAQTTARLRPLASAATVRCGEPAGELLPGAVRVSSCRHALHAAHLGELPGGLLRIAAAACAVLAKCKLSTQAQPASHASLPGLLSLTRLTATAG